MELDYFPESLLYPDVEKNNIVFIKEMRKDEEPVWDG